MPRSVRSKKASPQPPVVREQVPDLFPLTDSQEGRVSDLVHSSATDKRKAHRDFYVDMAKQGAARAALPAVLGVVTASPITLGAAGFAALTAVEQSNSNKKGKVEVRLDGAPAQVRYYQAPEHHVRSHDEARAELTVSAELLPILPAATLPAEFHRASKKTPALEQLAQQGRLVADLRHSVAGEPIVQKIEASAVSQLLAKGVPLYVVSVSSIETSQAHQLALHAENFSRTNQGEVFREWVERQVTYTLSPLESVEAAESVPEGAGLPTGINGVYRDRTSSVEAVAVRKEEFSTGFSETFNHDELHSSSSYREDSVAAVADNTFGPLHYSDTRDGRTGMGRMGGVFGALPALPAASYLNTGALDPTGAWSVLLAGIYTGSRVTTLLMDRHMAGLDNRVAKQQRKIQEEIRQEIAESTGRTGLSEDMMSSLSLLYPDLPKDRISSLDPKVWETTGPQSKT
jgi:hypothetical protein